MTGSKFADLLLKVGKLKSIKRSGWVREGMPDPESVAEHSFRVAFLTLLLGDELKLDKNKLFKIAFLHDAEEFETKDPVVQRGTRQIGRHDYSREKEIMKDLFKNLPNKDELYSLWEEHIGEDSPESTDYSKIVYQINKIADVWQALEYELAGQNPRKLDEWWINAKAHIKHPLIKKWLDELESQRKNE